MDPLANSVVQIVSIGGVAGLLLQHVLKHQAQIYADAKTERDRFILQLEAQQVRHEARVAELSKGFKESVDNMRLSIDELRGLQAQIHIELLRNKDERH